MNLNQRLRKALSANANAANFTAKSAIVLASSTETDAVPNSSCIRLAGESGGGPVPDRVRLFPYGVGSDNNVFSMRIWGWLRIPLESSKAVYFLPSILGEFSCTLSGFTGLTGGPVLGTERFADTISIVANVGEATITADTTRGGTVELYSPANDTPAWVELPLRGVEFIEFDWDQTTGTPTENCLMQFIDEPR